MDDHRHLGTTEVAALLGVSRQRAAQLAQRPDFPPPADRLSMGPLWHHEDIAGWQRAHPQRPSGRPKKDAAPPPPS